MSTQIVKLLTEKGRVHVAIDKANNLIADVKLPGDGLSIKHKLTGIELENLRSRAMKQGTRKKRKVSSGKP